MEEKKVLLYGIGNEVLTDDGIGPKIVKWLKNEFSYSFVQYETAFLGGMEILDYIQGFDIVIFIDAIKTKNGKPGMVYTYTPDDFKETLHLSHIHDVSFLTALKLGKEVGYQIPENIQIVAVEIVEDLVFSDSFSSEIQKQSDSIFQTVKEYVESIIQS